MMNQNDSYTYNSDILIFSGKIEKALCLQRQNYVIMKHVKFYKVHALSRSRFDVHFTFVLRYRNGKSFILVKDLPPDWKLIG